MAFTSGILGSYVYANKNFPSLAFHEWNVAEPTSPVGYRNVVSGIATYVKQLNTSESGAMQFEDAVVDFSSLDSTYSSQVQCFTFINTEVQYFLSNLRFWMPSGTALATGGYIEYAASGTWVYNAVLPSGNGDEVPTSLPASQNVYNQDDEDKRLRGLGDEGSSQFVYLGLSVPSGMPLGRYGVGGTGNLVFRITYDWYNKLSPVEA